MTDSIAIVGAKRTPIGAFGGVLAKLPAPELGRTAIAGALEDAGLPPEAPDQVLMGCVLQAGLGQAPARQAAKGAGLPDSTACTTINKVCGSGMVSAMLGADLIRAGSADAVIAGGMESMSRAPFLLDRSHGGLHMGHAEIQDHMFLDGLEDAYGPEGQLMGVFAEDTAEAYQISRDDQDAYALSSLDRARRAMRDGTFVREIVPVLAPNGKVGPVTITEDEPPMKAHPEKVARLKPAFRDGGTVTAANSSGIADGAAALALMNEEAARRQGTRVRALLRAQASHGQEPALFTTAPVGAIQKVLDAAGWTRDDVDLFEINEAFAVVALVVMRELGLDAERVNVSGGSCALGHPIGATGARLLVTLMNALETRNLRRGVAALCIGGGEATAIAIERPEA